jgi:hypothetical protein
LIQILIPALAVFLAIFLYFRRPSAYVGFTLWVWFLAPLVRRLVDWQFGWRDQSLILLSPHLVASVAALSLIVPSRRREIQIPPAFILCGAGVLYGFIVGMFVNPSAEVIYGLLNWGAPLLFGMYLAMDWRYAEENRKTVLTCFVWCAGLTGIYGIYQYFVAPKWDTFWLQNISAGLIDPSFGQPEPMLIRVWSTMNAPGVFAGTLTSALLLMIVARSPFKIPFAIAGYVAFLLTAVRAAWLGWIVGLVLLLRKARPKLLVQILASMALIAVCVLPIVQNPQLAPMIGDRLKTLGDLKQDTSFRERQDMYRVVLGVILNDPFGHGLKNQEIVHNLAVDSGVLTTILSLGWLGTSLYFGGVVFFIYQSGRKKGEDLYVHAFRSVCFAALAQYVGGNIFVNISGAVFWICAGSAIAGNQWQIARSSQVEESPLPAPDLGPEAVHAA